MADSIQILGIEYQFEQEIEATFETMLRFNGIQKNKYEGLSQVAFQFRMLRQKKVLH